MLRGGSWINNARNTRSAYRNRNAPDNRDNNTGFRLARAQTGAGRRMMTRPSSRPHETDLSCGKKQMVTGMLVGTPERLPVDFSTDHGRLGDKYGG